MSVTDRCTPYTPTFMEKVYYNLILLWVGLFIARLIHDAGHYVADLLVSGTAPQHFGLQLFYVVPMFTMSYDTSSVFVVLAGPVVAILIGWWVGLSNTTSSLAGPCGGRNKWKKRRGLVFGFVLQALWDAIYLVPVVDPMPFTPGAHGDGIEVAKWFMEHDLHETVILGTEVIINPAYLIAGAALLGSFWVIWKLLTCKPEMCNTCTV